MDLHTFLTTLADPALSDDDVWEHAQDLVGALSGDDDATQSVGLHALANRISCEPNRQRRAIIATVAGALIEVGGDPWIVAEAVLQPIPGWLEHANRLLDVCLQRLDENLPDIDGELSDVWLQDPLPDDAAEEEFSDESPFDKVLEEACSEMPEEADCWTALNLIWQPVVALLSREQKLRQAAKQHQHLAQQLSDYHEGSYWLNSVYEILDNEPILIVAPDKKAGFLGSISGVADNMQLQTLIIHAALRLGIGCPTAISDEIVAVATGCGPQSVDEVVEVQWNMYSWEALRPNHRLPDPEDYNASDHWIWGEGTPADIPVLDGYRVILIGPPSYKRSWPAQRRFAGMRAELCISSPLSSQEVEGWLNRMSAEKLNGH